MSDGSIWSKLETMGVLEENSKIIFFLNLSNKLPPFYIQLSQELNYRAINLVPIKVEQIPIFLKQNKNIKIICSVTNFTELEAFKGVTTGIIPSLVRQGRITFFHFSSFDLPLSVSTGVHREKYIFIKLPERFSEICNLIEGSFYNEEQPEERWPGGIKASLPKPSPGST